MNEKQIDREITYLTDQRKFYESFLLPISTGLAIAFAGKDFLSNTAIISLSAIGSIAVILILITRKNINKQIKNLIRL
jgi:hypothetical protein